VSARRPTFDVANLTPAERQGLFAALGEVLGRKLGRDEGERGAAYREYDEQVSTAWKKSTASVTGDEFLDAAMALHERNDIAPLLAFVRSDRPLSSENRDNLARLIKFLHARSQPRREGKPGGKHLRWQKPEYVAAFLVDQFKEAWRREHGKDNVPATQEAKFVDAVIHQMGTWAMMRGKPPLRRERIIALLREPKDRRL
jgi:hypothetical protein